MANPSSSPIMEILFGVKGGGDINRGSGQAILRDISEIVRQIEESGATKIKFSAQSADKAGASGEVKTAREMTEQLGLQNQSAKELVQTKKQMAAASAAYKAAAQAEKLQQEQIRTATAQLTLEKKKETEATKQQNAATRAAAKAASFLHQQRVKYNGLLNTSKKYKDQIARAGLTGEMSAMLEKFRNPDVKNFDGSPAKMTKEVDDFNRKMIEAGVYQEQFGEKTKKAFTTNLSTKIAAAAVAALIQSLRRLINTTKELDACVTDLQIATGLSREQTRELVKSYSDLAKQIGATTVEVAQAADTWLRQGYSIEEANELIIQSTMLSKLGQMDAASASEALTSALNGYKLEAADAASVVDKLTAVDMESATTAGGLAKAMSETANSARLAGVSMDELIGYLAVVKEVTQDGDEAVGNFAKTMFARMGNLKAGNLSDPETGESLSNVEDALSGVGIKLRENNSEFRDFGEVLSEVGSEWASFSSVQKRALAVAFAGTRQQEKFFVLMENWDDVQKYIDTAATSGGTAAAKFEDAYLTGVEAAQNRFTATFEDLTQNLMDGGALTGLLEFGTAILNILNPLAMFLGLLDGLPVKLVAIVAGTTLLTKRITLLRAATTASGTALLSFSGILETIKAHPVMATITAIVALATIATSVYNALTTSAEKRQEQLNKELDDLQEQIDKYDQEIDAIDGLIERLDEAYGDKKALLSLYDDLSQKIDVQTGLLNGEADAWSDARAKLLAYKKTQEEEKAKTLTKFSTTSKDAFNNNLIVREDLFLGIDLAEDIDGEYIRNTIKKYLAEANLGLNGLYTEVDLLFKLTDGFGEEIDVKAFMEQQVQYAMDGLAGAIEGYDGVGGPDFVRKIIEGLVYSGWDPEEISGTLSTILQDEGIQSAYHKLEEAISSGEDVQTAYNSLWAEMLEYQQQNPFMGSAAQYLVDMATNYGEVKETINSTLFAAETFADSLQRLSQSAQPYVNAINEMSQNGFLSAETALKLIDTAPDLADKMTVDTSGRYLVNVQMLQEELDLLQQIELQRIQMAEEEIERQIVTLTNQSGEYAIDSDEYTTAQDKIQSLRADLEDLERRKQVFSHINLHNLVKDSKEFSTWWSSAKKSIEPIVSAFSQMDENGYLEIDTLFALADIDASILSMVEEQNGQYKISQQYLEDQLELKKQSLLLDLKAQKNSKLESKSYYSKLLEAQVYYQDQVDAALQNLYTNGDRSAHDQTLSNAYKYIQQTWGFDFKDLDVGKLGIDAKQQLDLITTELAGFDQAQKVIEGLSFSSAAIGGTSPGEKALDKYNEWRAKLDHQLEMDQITEDQYYDQIRNNYKKLLGTYKETADERNKIQEELYKWDKEKPLRDWEAFYDKLTHQRDMDLISEEMYWKTISQKWTSMLKEAGVTADKFKEIKEQLYDRYKELYKEDLESQKDSLDKQITDIEDFYDEQKEMLEEQWADEETEDERAEQAKNISEIRKLIAELERDGSARARRQLIDAREELAEAEKERDEWEKEQAQDAILETLEKQKTEAVEKIEEQVKNVEEKLNNIDEGIGAIRSAVLSWAKENGYSITGLATGTASAGGGLYVTQEAGPEALAYNLGLGRFTYLTPESKVWNAGATEVLYEFANAPSRFLSRYMSLLSDRAQGVASTAIVTVGDIVIQGTADATTVAALRKERDNIVYTVLDKFKKMR